VTNLWLALIILALTGFAYQYGIRHSRRLAATSGQRMHSLPVHYGTWIALWCGLPALLILLFWLFAEGDVMRLVVLSSVPDASSLAAVDQHSLVARVVSIADGYGVVGDPVPAEVAAADRLVQARTIIQLALVAAVAAVGILGFTLARRRLAPRLRARNQMEAALRVLLLACSGVAILTTAGIVLSMLSEAIRFFAAVPAAEFFFGTVWNPRFASVGTEGAGGFGLLPLLWGTLLVTAIAMCVAIPIGLMSAVYLAEYASPRLRAYAKPAIEVLAGIPSIVYGVFALFTMGPFFRQAGGWIGLDINATSAFTAGVVMGIMIVPFISSLSDDVITQVPRSMREGSLGLGATRSETIMRVVLPAALPGIVGAVLLAVSKAIGETMIVVMVAGNSPVLQPNPFEAVSTITVTIVNQLTGDTDFASPQSLVGFALGITLFVMTLGLNIVALQIVRKYREQYE
jgi:phosphate transport system permease protein